MNRNYYVITFISKYLSREARVAIFDDIMIVLTMFIKTIFKDSRKLKELEIMYQNAIYMCIS